MHDKRSRQFKKQLDSAQGQGSMGEGCCRQREAEALMSGMGKSEGMGRMKQVHRTSSSLDTCTRDAATIVLSSVISLTAKLSGSNLETLVSFQIALPA